MCYIGKETGGVMKYMIVALITVAALASPAWAGNDVRVLEVRGEAAMRTGVDGEWIPLHKGAILKAGCWIQTSLATRLYLKIWNNTVVQILSASLVEIEKVEEDGNRQTGRLNLALGTVKVNVRRDRTEIVDFRVNSPRMTTAVKGTYWTNVFLAHLGLSLVEVLRGMVWVAPNGGERTLATSETGTVGAGSAADPDSGDLEVETAGGSEGGRMSLITLPRLMTDFTREMASVLDQRKMEDMMSGTESIIAADNKP
jgi:hypothetical protein